jgi:hypothetical protein
MEQPDSVDRGVPARTAARAHVSSVRAIAASWLRTARGGSGFYVAATARR